MQMKSVFSTAVSMLFFSLELSSSEPASGSLTIRSTHTAEDALAPLTFDRESVSEAEPEGTSTLWYTGPDILDESYWNQVTELIKAHPRRAEVRHIHLNNCVLSKQALVSFSHFPNVEKITVGASIEGVVISSAELEGILYFKKIRCLHLSIHGLSGEHLKVISRMKNLEDLIIEYPDRTMTPLGKSSRHQWTPVKIDDEAIKSLAKLESLEFLAFGHVPSSLAGRVALTEKALVELLKLPNLESLSIGHGSFTREAVPLIRKMSLPSFVVGTGIPLDSTSAQTPKDNKQGGEKTSK